MVISDIVMPEMDGFELCMEIKKETRFMHLPVLLLTTLSEPEDVIRGLECGADNFMNKPYEESVLLSRIHYILLNRGLRKEMVGSEMSIDIMFNGKKQTITSHRIQILDLLLSTCDTAIQKNRELQKANRELRARRSASWKRSLFTLVIYFVGICSLAIDRKTGVGRCSLLAV
ncbi:MAG: response regulator [Syntrophales bacterium]